jgi:Lrp/AsnC family transcriptional regulator for asnA, asnC and gidA
MTNRIDDTDYHILTALTEDGRRSLRDIARTAGVSTPTVESRLRKMVDMGLIKKISPIIDASKITNGLFAVATANVEPSKLEETLNLLAKIPEVRNVFGMTGEHDVLFTVFASGLDELQSLMSSKISSIANVSSLTYNVVSKVVKDEPNVPLRPGLLVRLACDTCGQIIKSDPVTLLVGDRNRYFCCEVCLREYKEKYGGKLTKLMLEHASKEQSPGSK